MTDLRTTPEPTGEQCNTNATTIINGWHATAAWYPQMGGYVAKAWILAGGDPDGCIEVLIWHDGQFPFTADTGDTRPPALLHHCDPDQFREFADVADRALAAAAVQAGLDAGADG